MVLTRATTLHPERDLVRTDRIRLDYLDGLRGLAATYVVLEHIYQALRFYSPAVVLPDLFIKALSIFNIGQLAVDIFIVLSGYSLMIPVIKADGQLKGGFFTYMRRRATRILPPYYAALALTLLITALMNATGLLSPPNYSDFRWEVILSHVLVIHNWHPDWIHAIDPPMWSVATEWQIYFLFPLLLLPIWRRFGTLAAILAGFALGMTPHYLLHGFLDSSFPWYIGLFALGMSAAVVNFSPDPRMTFLRERAPWGWLSIVVGGGIILYCVLNRGWYGQHQIIADPLIGAGAACLLVFCTHATLRTAPGAQQPLALKLFGSPWATGLGHFSYSIYLIHYPLLSLFWHLTLPLQISAVARAALLYAVAFPLMIGASYLFHLAFERRFMPGR